MKCMKEEIMGTLWKVIRLGGEHYLLRVCYEVVGIIRKNLITLLEFFNSYCRVMVCF